MENPHYYLSQLSNKDVNRILCLFGDNNDLHELLVDVLTDDNIDIDEIYNKIKNFTMCDKMKEKIKELNQTDDMFREVARYFRDETDMLSKGSFMVGELEKEPAHLKTIYSTGDKDENNK
jgi:hypothetical protein